MQSPIVKEEPSFSTAGLLTADQARELAGRSIGEKIKTVLGAVHDIATSKGFELRLGKDSPDPDLWVDAGAGRHPDWLVARKLLQGLGYGVTYDRGETVISWGA